MTRTRRNSKTSAHNRRNNLQIGTSITLTQEVKLDKNDKVRDNVDGRPRGEATNKIMKGYSMKECQSILGVSRCVIDRLISTGELACYKIGEKRKFVTRNSLDTYLSQLVDDAETAAKEVRIYGF